MKNLLRSEWQRLWSQKISWICFLAIPILLAFSARLHLRSNAQLSPDHQNFTYANNFPVSSISEHLIITLNVIVLIIVVLHVAHEYHSGQMRFVLQRTATFKNIILAKWLTIVSFIALFLFAYFMMSIVFGFIFFDYQSQLTLLFYTETSGPVEVLLYNLLYYGLAFITLITMASVMMTFSLLSKSTTGAVVLCVGFIIISLMYPNIILLFINTPLAGAIIYTSLVLVQFEGITFFLAGGLETKAFLLTVILGYFVLSSLITSFLTRKRDHFI